MGAKEIKYFPYFALWGKGWACSIFGIEGHVVANSLTRKREWSEMKNCEMKLTGNILTITVDISKNFGKSSSGKSEIIASTEGNVSIPEKDDIKIGLNVYKKA
jgi:hypothetical protein